MKKLSALLVAICAGAFGFLPVPPALGGSGPPNAVLITSEGRQEGHPYTWTKTRPAGEDMCSIMHADGFMSFQDALRHDADKKARIRFQKARRPEHVSLVSWAEVTREGYPKGRARKVPFRLHRHIVDGRVVAWDAIFRTRRLGHYYLSADASWDPGTPCSGQSAAWVFHLKAV